MDQKQLFFSVVIPAHNEEKYIENTLTKISNLNYPIEKFEVVVVENGSTDKTFEIVKKFEGGNIRVLKSEKGVSKAKNFGIKQISNLSDWIVFLDADTILESNFLKDLDLFLQKNSDKNLTVGTTSVKPLENKSWQARMWMGMYDLVHKYTKVSYSIQIAKTSLMKKVKFNEKLRLAEDLQFIKDCLVYGKFFYFDTDAVLTSVRRFEKIGWIKLFVIWTWGSILWRFRDPEEDYPVIR